MSDSTTAPNNAPNDLPPIEQELYKKREKIYPREVHGIFAVLRNLAMAALLGLYYGLAWIDWNGHQAVLFDLPARKFYIFGFTFWPQDFFFLALLLIIAALSLFFFTTLAGRLWCGYACPQTVWTEMYMLLERWIEGDRKARMKLDKGPKDFRRLRIKVTKQVVWILFSLWTGFTFVGYFTPIKELWVHLVTWNLGPWETFWIFFYGFATYGNAGFMREQVCIYMCPYARFQSAMFDKNTLIISYDEKRGDPRGSRKRGMASADVGLGDCIDCKLCVQVCPVGIDIRDGFQMECIGCGACIDACDDIMDKMRYPRGLIRYATQNGMAGHLSGASMLQRVWRPRTLLYGAALLAGVSAFAWSLASRPPFRVDVIRDRGVMARLADDGGIDNVYRLFVMNSAEDAHDYQIDVSGTHGVYGLRVDEGQQLTLGPMESRQMTLRIHLSPETAANLVGQVVPIQIGIEQTGRPGESVRVMEKSTFIVPR